MVRLPQALTARLRGCWAFAAVLAAAAAAHLPSQFNGFVWDDLTFIIGNPVLREARSIPAIFTNPETLGTGAVNPYYRPLTTLSFLIDTLLWGELPAGFHATNLLLHLGVCALLLAVLRRLLSSGAAFVGALLFAVHPAHAEPVAFVSARADLLCAFFVLAAFLAWMHYGETGSRAALALAPLAYFAALLAKIAAGLYPAVFALYGLLFFRRRPRLWELLPFAAGAIGFLAISNAVLDMVTWPDPPLALRVATAGPVILHYVLMTLAPSHLSVFHDLPVRTSFDATVVGAWTVVTASVMLAAACARRAPRAALGLAWFLAGIVPVSGLVTLLYPAIAADRYLYLPLLGAALVAGAGLQQAAGLRLAAPFRRLATVTAALALLALAGSTMARGRLWRDPVTLWERAVVEAPRHPYVLNSLGVAYTSVRRGEDALRALLGALELNESNPDTHLNLASLAFLRDDVETAAQHTFRALELNPGSARAYGYLGRIMHQPQNAAAARRAAERALDQNVLDAGTLEMLAGPRSDARPPAGD